MKRTFTPSIHLTSFLFQMFTWRKWSYETLMQSLWRSIKSYQELTRAVKSCQRVNTHQSLGWPYAWNDVPPDCSRHLEGPPRVSKEPPGGPYTLIPWDQRTLSVGNGHRDHELGDQKAVEWPRHWCWSVGLQQAQVERPVGERVRPGAGPAPVGDPFGPPPSIAGCKTWCLRYSPISETLVAPNAAKPQENTAMTRSLAL